MPSVSVQVTVPPAPPPLPAAHQDKNEGGGAQTSVNHAASPEAVEHAPQPDVALQISIKMPTAAEPAPAPKTQPLPAAPSPDVTPVPVVHLAAAAVPTPVATHAQPSVSRPPEAGHAAPTAPAEPAERETTAQPLKSVTLEFTPDGANDVRLKVSERAGEVHISLHSTDASLSGKLHEGVHDLVGTLSKAGYEAEAWTPGQGHQGNQREQEQRRPTASPKDPEADEFAGVFEQQHQEAS